MADYPFQFNRSKTACLNIEVAHSMFVWRLVAHMLVAHIKFDLFEFNAEDSLSQRTKIKTIEMGEVILQIYSSIIYYQVK